jgi:hypothetical protein
VSNDVLDLLRDRNPVPVDPPPPPIGSVLSRVDEAQAAAVIAAAAATEDRSRGRRGQVGGWVVVAAGAALALIVIVVLAGTQRRSAPRTGAAGSGGGLVAPVLGPGKAWSYLTVEQSTTQFQRPGSPILLGALLSGSRAVVVSRSRVQTWVTVSGAQRSRGRDVGKPRFIGSASDRASWVKEHRVGHAVPTASFSTPGFAAGGRTLSYSQVLGFPTDRSAVLRLLHLAKGGASERMAEIGSLLQSLPLLGAARAAVFAALARVRGVQELGSVRDPLGRPGIALAAAREPFPRSARGTPGPVPGGERVLRTRSELIFDPRTMALLASETVLLEPSRIAGIDAGYPVTWTAYLASRAVSAASVPTLRELFGRHGVPRPVPVLRRTPISGTPAPVRGRLRTAPSSIPRP